LDKNAAGNYYCAAAVTDIYHAMGRDRTSTRSPSSCRA
jgi:hypothetical protein